MKTALLGSPKVWLDKTLVWCILTPTLVKNIWIECEWKKILYTEHRRQHVSSAWLVKPWSTEISHCAMLSHGRSVKMFEHLNTPKNYARGAVAMSSQSKVKASKLSISATSLIILKVCWFFEKSADWGIDFALPLLNFAFNLWYWWKQGAVTFATLRGNKFLTLLLKWQSQSYYWQMQD